MSAELPPNPNLHQLKIQGHELLHAFRAGKEEAFARLSSNFPKLKGADTEKIREANFGLRDALLVVAREYGYDSWPKLQAHIINDDEEAALPHLYDATPILPVPNLKETLEYYGKVLGFPFPGWSDGAYGGSGCLVFREQPDLARIAKGLETMINVEDVDEIYELHKSKGAKIVREIYDSHYGTREYHVEDINGYNLRFFSSTE